MLDANFVKEFLPTFLGVLVSIGLSVGIWFARRYYVNRGNRKWIKENLAAELCTNMNNLLLIQDTIKGALSKGIVLTQFFPFYMNLNIYNTALTTGYIRLLTPQLQSEVHKAASYMQAFNTLLANIDAFGVHNRSLPSFTDELKQRCDSTVKQAEAFMKNIRETLLALGERVAEAEIEKRSLSIIGGVTNLYRKSAHSAILELVNEGTKREKISLRAKSEKAERTYFLEAGVRAWAIVPLVDGKFQAKVSNPNCKIYLRGYMTA